MTTLEKKIRAEAKKLLGLPSSCGWGTAALLHQANLEIRRLRRELEGQR